VAPFRLAGLKMRVTRTASGFEVVIPAKAGHAHLDAQRFPAERGVLAGGQAGAARKGKVAVFYDWPVALVGVWITPRRHGWHRTAGFSRALSNDTKRRSALGISLYCF
jgi:hypothetical protein